MIVTRRFPLAPLLLSVFAAAVAVTEDKNQTNAENTELLSGCGEGEWFDIHLSVCRSLCTRDEVYDAETQMCTVSEDEAKDKEDSTHKAPVKNTVKLQKKPTCKILVLRKSLYEIAEDADGATVYVIPKLDMSVRDAQINEGTRELSMCFNFSPTFMTCTRWSLDKGEYELRDDDLNLWVPAYERLYGPSDFYVRQHNDSEDAVVCAFKNHDVEHRHRTVIIIYVVSWIISLFCLVVAFVLCVTVPGLRVYHQILPFYIASLFVAYLILTFRTFTVSQEIPAVCYTYAVVLQFSFLAAFFWLNILAFDIWRIVSNIRNGTENKLKSCHGLLAYISYGFGTPLLIVLVTVIVDNNLLDNPFHPNFQANCWFESDKARLVFFYGPIAAILIVNIVFFIFTIFNIRAATQTSPEGANKKKHLFRMTFELAVVMGLCWIMEVVSWAAGGDDRYWYVTDVINGLQGLFILVVILRKPTVMNAILVRVGLGNKEENSQLTDVTTQDKDNAMKTFETKY